MKSSRFDLLMTSIDDSLLEEALQPYNPRPRRVKLFVQIAACFCLIVGMLFLLRYPPTKTIVKNPAEAKDLHLLNYDLPSLEGHAYSVDYALYDYGEEYLAPLAEAVLTTESNNTYVVRSLRTDSSTDISGMTTQDMPLIWAYGPSEFRLCSNQTSAWVSWYSSETQLQYCISTNADSITLLQTAADIVKILGYQMAISPEGATDIVYRTFLYDGLTVSETAFRWNGTAYRFRMASTMDIAIPFADISGIDRPYHSQRSCEVLWCPAELFTNSGQGGKIIWFDVVPGLLYSLSTEDFIEEEQLLSVAESLFHPAQEGN